MMSKDVVMLRKSKIAYNQLARAESESEEKSENGSGEAPGY